MLMKLEFSRHIIMKIPK